ncbi:MAG: LPS export ABC transporter periplasmic protein LptC [Desulfobacteraceae bacterium]|nr:MAG: LPS export ABC transporter periplasmic protein LptC [Desulfobacteraceae bacterium]
MNLFLKKHWPLLGIGILLLVLSLYIIRSQKPTMKESLPPDAVTQEGLKLENISYTQNDPDEGMKWILDAKEVRFSKDKTFFSFRNFRLKLQAENRPRVELEGKRGDYDKNSGEINLRGDLRGHTDNGYRIITDHILYKEKEGYFKTDEPVKIFGPFFSVAGRGLYFNPEKEILRIISDVTTRINRDSLVL